MDLKKNMQNTLERKAIKNIDFNCDLAQSFGIYKNSTESRLLDYVSSVNISCGFHAGDPLTIKEALLEAKANTLVLMTFKDLVTGKWNLILMSLKHLLCTKLVQS